MAPKCLAARVGRGGGPTAQGRAELLHSIETTDLCSLRVQAQLAAEGDVAYPAQLQVY